MLNAESDLDRIYMMNRKDHGVSFLIIMFILSKTRTGFIHTHRP